MKKNRVLVALVAFYMLGTWSAAAYQYDDYQEKKSSVQALLGGVKYDGLVFKSSDPDEEITMDMSTLPQLGGAWSTLPKGDTLQYGLEASFLLGFKFDDVNTYSGARNTYISVSSYLWMFDIAGGAYLNLPLGDKLRIYGGAGPLILLSYYNSKSEYFDGSISETAVGFGAYARTGFELKLHQHAWLGVGVRGNWSNIDFSDVGGSSELSGLAGFITYTAGF